MKEELHPMQQLSPVQLMEKCYPLLEQAMNEVQQGLPLATALQQVVLSSYMVARGVPPTHAFAMAQQMTTNPSTAKGIDESKRELVRSLEKEIQDEANAAAFYGELEAAATDPVIKDYIHHAMEDERKHYKMLNSLHMQLTGRTFEASPQPTPFPDLRSGLKKAMDNEYEAFEEYRRLYLGQTSQLSRDLFFEILTDELEHATRFAYALQIL